MAERRAYNPISVQRNLVPAKSPEERENQLIALAADLVERQLMAGTASAQVITHYLKLGSSREKLEQQRLASEVELLAIKQETLASEARVETMYKEAMDAFRGYQGHPSLEPEDVFDD